MSERVGSGDADELGLRPLDQRSRVAVGGLAVA
jgi:hypothetical protein